MTKQLPLTGTLYIYESRFKGKVVPSQRYRWRFVYTNSKKGPNGGEGFVHAAYALSSAQAFINPNIRYGIVRLDSKGRVVWEKENAQ